MAGGACGGDAEPVADGPPGDDLPRASHVERLESVRAVARLLLVADSAQVVARSSLEVIRRFVSIARASVTEIDHARGETVVLAAIPDVPGRLAAGTRMPVAADGLLRRYAAGERLVVEDIDALEEPSALERSLSDQGVRCYVNIPLVEEDELVGSLNIGSPQPNGFSTADVSLVQDLAGLIAVALRQARLREQLDDKSQRLQATVEELRQVDAWRLGLVNMLAHDVRAPLGTIISSLEVARSRMDALRPDQLRALLTGAQRSARRTMNLAMDLLDLSRSQHGSLALTPEQVAVAPAVEAAVAILAPDPPVNVQIPEDLTGYVDPGRLEQIVVNLVGNASRHGAPPIEVSAGARADGGLCLIVEDHGGGVPESQVEGLFASFAHGTRSDSVGLGLWIVRELAEAHGGTVDYADAPHGGARFVVDLPGPS